ncbi:FAD-dependent oxidoreductase [Vibrio harveyi]|nr:FAD-dependent oxidoreductase [Vibrio harveyi]
MELSYDKLVITTGAKPIVPPVKGIELDNIFTLTRLEDGIKLKEKLQNDSIKKVAVIGSGFIGLECLEMLAEFNKEITLIEKESQLNKRVFDKEITDLLEENLIKNNINIIKNNGLAYFEKSDSNNINIVLENNSKLEVDLVILAIGFRPATGFLNDSNIEMLKNGAIVVNNKGRTNLADI